MANQITGKIIAALPHKSGVSQRTGNPWELAEYVVETHEQYSKKCVFQVSGTERINSMNLQVGDEVTVYIDIDAHEYNGRWFNNISAYRVDRQGQQQAQPQGQSVPQAQAPAQQAPQAALQQQATQPAQPASNGSSDDLPF